MCGHPKIYYSAEKRVKINFTFYDTIIHPANTVLNILSGKYARKTIYRYMCTIYYIIYRHTHVRSI